MDPPRPRPTPARASQGGSDHSAGSASQAIGRRPRPYARAPPATARAARAGPRPLESVHPARRRTRHAPPGGRPRRRRSPARRPRLPPRQALAPLCARANGPHGFARGSARRRILGRRTDRDPTVGTRNSMATLPRVRVALLKKYRLPPCLAYRPQRVRPPAAGIALNREPARRLPGYGLPILELGGLQSPG